MTVRIDAVGNVQFGKPPTQPYTIVWRNLRSRETATESRTETLKILRDYVFRTAFDYNFTGRGPVVEAEIWRTYKNQSKRVR
ncbi:hypothetical protein ACFYW9_19145 [Streptomyces sp. NPDC002698]|uniref:hypothetical protein n=1 Tax=Streptomyces sp. NPDC002698 TaxID=3364660 RepID=UPI0036B9617E